MIVDLLRFFGKDEIVLGIASLVGILGFILTVFVSIRTANISKILRSNQLTNQYNRERLAFQKAFIGHQKSILEDGIRTDKLIKDILQQAESYRTKYSEIMTLYEKLKVVILSPDLYGEFITRLLNLVQSQFPSGDAFIDSFLKSADSTE